MLPAGCQNKKVPLFSLVVQVSQHAYAVEASDPRVIPYSIAEYRDCGVITDFLSLNLYIYIVTIHSLEDGKIR